MDPRQELYAALVEQLKNIPEVKHVDLWNENVVYADQDEPWQRPAVFIELGVIDWTTIQGALRGNGDIKLHTVIDWSENAPIEAWQLTDKIWQALKVLEANRLTGIILSKLYPIGAMKSCTRTLISSRLSISSPGARRDKFLLIHIYYYIRFCKL